MTFVSCILATRGNSPFLDLAINSILNQTHQDFELLLMVNGDRKDYEALKQKYSHPKISVHYSSIRQLAHNLNYGIDLAKGDFIARMDDDDISSPERFRSQLQYLSEHPRIMVVSGNAIFIDESGKEISKTEREYSPAKITSRLWLYNDMIHPSVMMRKSAILEVGGYSGHYSEDQFLWMRLTQKFSDPLAIMSDKLIRYRIHPGQERGRLACYAASASYMLFNFLMFKKMIWFFATIVASLKSFIRATKL